LPDSTYGKTCLKIPLDISDVNNTGRLHILAHVFIQEFFNQYWSHRVYRYKKGVCPTGKMASWGKYRRNLISFKETSRYLSCWTVFAITTTVIVVTSVYVNMFTTTNLFWLNNLLVFAFVDIFHGIVIPLRMKIPSKSTNQTALTSNFYVRKPDELEPRRVFTGNQYRPGRFSYNLSPPSPPPPTILPAMVRTLVLPGREGEPGRTAYCSRSSLGPTAHTHQKLTDVKDIDVHTSQDILFQQLTSKGKGKGKNRHTVTHIIGDQLNRPESKIYQYSVE
jgi:hypothetical protein